MLFATGETDQREVRQKSELSIMRILYIFRVRHRKPNVICDSHSINIPNIPNPY